LVSFISLELIDEKEEKGRHEKRELKSRKQSRSKRATRCVKTKRQNMKMKIRL